jgi:hypothetical protein
LIIGAGTEFINLHDALLQLYVAYIFLDCRVWQLTSSISYILNYFVALICRQYIAFECIIQEIQCRDIGDAIVVAVFFYIFQIAAPDDIVIEFAISHACTLSISECIAKIGIFEKHVTSWGKLTFFFAITDQFH